MLDEPMQEPMPPAVAMTAFCGSCTKETNEWRIDPFGAPRCKACEPRRAFVWTNPLLPYVYHTQVRLPDMRDGLLVDIGAIHNLCGSAWLDRVALAAKNKGHGTIAEPLPKPMSVEGVGSGSSSANDLVTVPICLPDGTLGHYKAACISGSDLPALWGLDSLKTNRALIDTVHNKLFLLGPGGVQLKLSPGSVMYQLEEAATGHLLLPCAEWANARPSRAPTLDF
jgi:hypothetical protein